MGAAMAWLVGSAIDEITVNKLFSMLFGILLLVLAVVLLWRVCSTRSITGGARAVVIAGAILVGISGVISFLIEEPGKKKDDELSPAMKVPLYGLLGVSLSFSFAYTFLDLLLQGACNCGNEDSATPAGGITSARQVYATAGGCVALGLCFGLMFGLMDVEDGRHTFQSQLAWSLCVGALGGAAIGKANMHAADAQGNPDLQWEPSAARRVPEDEEMRGDVYDLGEGAGGGAL